jgi:site-specific DNA recombinase
MASGALCLVEMFPVCEYVLRITKHQNFVDDPFCQDDTDALDPEPRAQIERGTIAYARQSRASRSGYTSCEAQLAYCQQLAAERGWRVAATFSDVGRSSETLERPELQSMLAAIKSGAVARVIVYSLDRVTRRILHLHTVLQWFDEHGVELAVTSDPHFGSSAASRLMTNIVAAASEFQLELTRERMAEMRAARKRHGKRVAGRVPFGYRVDPVTRKLEPHGEQWPIIRDFFELAAHGARPSDLANLANHSQWKNHDGETGKWTARWITKLLKNPIYCGEIRDGDSTLPGEHAAIVKRAVFDTAQRELEGRRTSPAIGGARRARRNPYRGALLGAVVCGQCNRPMSTSVSHRGPIRYVYFRCRSHAGGRPPCPGVSISAFELEQFVCGMLVEAEDDQSEIIQELRNWWIGLGEMEQRAHLPKVIRRVLYHHQASELTIELKESYGE